MNSVYELFEYELYQQGKSVQTVRSYLSKIKYFLQWREKQFGLTAWSPVTSLDTGRYEAYCRQIKKYSDNSIRQRLSVICAYRNFLTAQGKETDRLIDQVLQELEANKNMAGTIQPVVARSLARFAL
ncbi:MAG TPA: site-specific integrase [bacterium]|jgi:site-specific recombinase XerD|nr:site-specific integrase [bacterium]